MIEKRPADYATNHLNIGADTVKRALTRQLEMGDITQDQHDLIWWYFNFAKDHKFSPAQTAQELGYADRTTTDRVFKGQYAASLDAFCDKVASFKKIADERIHYKTGFFVETSVAKRVFQVCDAARISNTVAFIFGDSQQGKTTALEEYTRQNNHGQTVYVRLPSSAGVQLLAKEIARACHVNPDSSFERVRDRVINALDHNRLVIIDELHQVFTSYHSASQVKVLEFLREIHDRTRCGMVLCGTHVLRREIEEGKLALILEQLRRRATLRLELPPKPTKTDVAKFAQTFGLPDPGPTETAIIREMVYASGLGMYVKFLQAGHRMAAKASQPMTWDHFLNAHAIIARAMKPTETDKRDAI
jgi:DNA transposition AAA+ family ATPase